MKIFYGLVAAATIFSGAAVANGAIGGAGTPQLATAVQGTTVAVDGKKKSPLPNLKQQAELVHALASSQMLMPAPEFDPGPICTYNCAPPTGGVTASPSVVRVPTGSLGNVSIRWTWNEERGKELAEYSCLWVSVNGEANAHVVQCEHPGHTYTTNLNWIGAGHSYVFRVAPGNPNGPYTQPIWYLLTLASTTVAGVAQ